MKTLTSSKVCKRLSDRLQVVDNIGSSAKDLTAPRAFLEVRWTSVSWRTSKLVMRVSTLIVCCIIVASGCDQPQANGSDVNRSSFQGRVVNTWDCGIVVRGEPTNVSFPLDNLGIASIDEIQEITTTCDCVKATAFVFGDHRPAVRLRIFHDDEENSKSSPRTQLLNVGIEFRLRSTLVYRHKIRFNMAASHAVKPEAI